MLLLLTFKTRYRGPKADIFWKHYRVLKLGQLKLSTRGLNHVYACVRKFRVCVRILLMETLTCLSKSQRRSKERLSCNEKQNQDKAEIAQVNGRK